MSVRSAKTFQSKLMEGKGNPVSLSRLRAPENPSPPLIGRLPDVLFPRKKCSRPKSIRRYQERLNEK
jgi:hypothetical protein